MSSYLERKRLAIPTFIAGVAALGSVACDNDIRDVEFNPINCNGEVPSAEIEVFLGTDQWIEVLGKKLSAPEPGILKVGEAAGDAADESDILLEPNGAIRLNKDDSDKYGIVNVRQSSRNGVEGTNLEILLNCEE